MNNELTKKAKDILENEKSKSLSERMNSLKSKISQMSKLKDQVLLCDTSGSMGAYVKHEDQEYIRAIDMVQSVVDKFAGANIYMFNSDCTKATSTNIGKPRGGTNMGNAFNSVKSQGHKKITLLTDGEPDSETDALRNAQGLVINIIYIGPEPTPPFLIKLAKITGGKFDAVQLIENQSELVLENKIKGFLSA